MNIPQIKRDISRMETVEILINGKTFIVKAEKCIGPDGRVTLNLHKEDLSREVINELEKNIKR